MKLPQYFISIITIIVLSFSGLFYFINQNHKKTTENSLEINQSRKTIKKIDAAFYTISELERNTQKYVITGNKDIEKNVENEIAELHDIIQELDESAKINPEGFDFLPLLVKKLDSQEYIRKNKLTAKEITTFLSNNADEKKSLRFYELVNETKQAYVKKTNNLLEKSQAINAINFKSSLIVCLVSILLIIITLLHETRNKKLRKLAENDTRQIEIKYKNLVDNSGVGLLTTDLNGHITYVNKRITAFTGFQHSEMIGRHFSSVVDADIAPSLMAFLHDSYSFEKPTLESWIGSGLDTTRAFSNEHQYPLMQTKNDVIDFIQGLSHLNGNTTYSVAPGMDENLINDKVTKEQLTDEFNRFKVRNEKLIQGGGLIPDSIYQKYFFH